MTMTILRPLNSASLGRRDETDSARVAAGASGRLAFKPPSALPRRSVPAASCGDPQAPGTVGSRRPKVEPGRSLVLCLKAELLEPLVKEGGRSEKGLDVAEPAIRAREPREFVERAEKVPSEFEANRDGQETVGIEREPAIIVEVKDTDQIAKTNGRAVGKSDSPVTALDLDPGRRPDLRRGRADQACWPRAAQRRLVCGARVQNGCRRVHRDRQTLERNAASVRENRSARSGHRMERPTQFSCEAHSCRHSSTFSDPRLGYVGAGLRRNRNSPAGGSRTSSRRAFAGFQSEAGLGLARAS